MPAKFVSSASSASSTSSASTARSAAFSRVRFAALLAVSAVIACASGRAHGNAPAADAPVAAPTPAAVEPRPAAHAAPTLQDPMDKLRDRLAQKLGAARTAGGGSPDLLQVVSKASAPVDAAPREAPAPSAHAVRRRIAAPVETAAGARTPGTAAAVAHAPAAEHPAHWGYGGEGGPQDWGRMKPEFAKCSGGTRQSPIDIRDGIGVDLEPIRFDYQPSAFRVIDNGHTVQVNVASGNSIEVTGRRYELLQFHFHRPSEERIDGRQFDMVAHLVHKDLDGRLAVVAVLLERGAAQPIVQNVWNNLPLEKGEEIPARVMMNLNELLPAERAYFTYMGSLTTPPCSEGVLWMVMKNAVPVSAEQIGIFARLYPMNARPIQAGAGRLIKQSN